MRLFVAIVPPLAAREQLARVRDALRARSSGLKWVETENIHLTLRFLGDVDLSRAEAVSKALAEVSARHPAFLLRFGGCGVFPNRRRPRVVWVGVEGDLDALCALQGDVERALAPLGFDPEPRAFSAHVTLGRVKAETARGLTEALDALEHDASASMSVDTVVLMESHLSARGATYRPLCSARLGTVAS